VTDVEQFMLMTSGIFFAGAHVLQSNSFNAHSPIAKQVCFDIVDASKRNDVRAWR
jgi:hypothetical protein